MNYQRLGSSELNISEIGLGCGTKSSADTDKIDEKEIIRTVHRALDLGINFFDTSDICQHGLTESLLARALGKNRKDIIIGTKVGLLYRNKKYTIDLSKKHIKTAVEQSLKRLDTDVIDLYQVHWPDLNNSLSGTFEALNECLEEGKIRYIGVSNFDLNYLELSRKYSLIVSHQVPLNLFKREYEIKILPYCYRENIGIICYNPLAQNLLKICADKNDTFASEYQGSNPMFKGDSLKRNLAIIDSLKQFAAIRNQKIEQLAIAWILAHTAVTSTITEVFTPAEIESHVKATDWNLDQEELAQIELLMNVAG